MNPSALFGWSGIQHHLLQHDVGMIKDYADDVDTFLVFASKKNRRHFDGLPPISAIAALMAAFAKL
jgi:hypothetical protein